jgi:hypothetical protein
MYRFEELVCEILCARGLKVVPAEACNPKNTILIAFIGDDAGDEAEKLTTWFKQVAELYQMVADDIKVNGRELEATLERALAEKSTPQVISAWGSFKSAPCPLPVDFHLTGSLQRTLLIFASDKALSNAPESLKGRRGFVLRPEPIRPCTLCEKM